MQFLDNVWLAQGVTGYGFVCIKNLQHWEDIPVLVTPEEVGPLPLVPRDADVYFTPNLFGQPQRRKEYMLDSCWLYADLDKVDPYELPRDVRPTVAWESSPGRYQGLWELPKELTCESHSRINKQLTYHLGADHSGWDATQVLRIPGTRNHKYPDKPRVRLLWERDRVVRQMKLRPLPSESDRLPQLVVVDRDNLPLWLKAKLRAKVATGDRSKVLWRIECGLIEAGLTVDEVFSLVHGTVWNKFKNNASLYAEILRAEARVARRTAA